MLAKNSSFDLNSRDQGDGVDDSRDDDAVLAHGIRLDGDSVGVRRHSNAKCQPKCPMRAQASLDSKIETIFNQSRLNKIKIGADLDET